MTKAVAQTKKWSHYPAYKDSGVEWLGEIPEVWEVKRLKYLSALLTQTIEAGGTKVGLENIESSTGRYLKTNTEFDGDGVVFNAGDILYGKLRPYLAKVLLAEQGGLAVGDFFVLHPTIEVLPKYLQYRLLEPIFTDLANGSTFGAKMPRVGWEFMGDLKFTVPPKDEQRAIAIFLDRETTRIDSLIEKKQRQIELLQEKRAALISHAVTKGLDPKAKMKDSGIEWLGQIPKHWKVMKLSLICTSIQTGPFGSQLHAAEYVDEGVPIINPANIQNGEIVPDHQCTVDELTFQRLIRHRLSESDIVFARRGEMGRCAMVTSESDGFLCGTGSLRVKLNRYCVDPHFIDFFLSTGGVKDHLLLESVGSTMDNLNTDILSRIPVAVPPIQEQVDIRKHMAQRLKQTQSTVDKVADSIVLLREYRTALISAAVTGKIDVREEEVA